MSEKKGLTAVEQFEILGRAFKAAGNPNDAAANRLAVLLEQDQAHVTKTEFDEGKIVFTSEFGEFTTIWKEGPE